jgi:hypothetical protein
MLPGSPATAGAPTCPRLPSEAPSTVRPLAIVLSGTIAEATGRSAARKERIMAEGYCVKERKKVEIKDPQQITMKNGRPAIQGTCPDCGTKIFKIGKLNG